MFTFDLQAALPRLLLLDCRFSECLDTLLPLDIDIKSVGHGHPLGTVDKLIGCLVAVALVARDPIVNVHIVDSECAVLFQRFNVYIIGIDQAVRLDPLRPRLVVKVVFTFEALVPLDSLLKLKLDLGVLRLEVERGLVYDV